VPDHKKDVQRLKPDDSNAEEAASCEEMPGWPNPPSPRTQPRPKAAFALLATPIDLFFDIPTGLG
jgi:hypothetical protein